VTPFFLSRSISGFRGAAFGAAISAAALSAWPVTPLLAADADPAAAPADPATDSFFSANALYNRRLYELAADEFKSFLAKYPNHEKASAAKFGLALSYYALANNKDAEPLLAKLVDDPKIADKAAIYNVWGYSLLGLAKDEEAAKAFAWTLDHGKEPAQVRSALVGSVEASFRRGKWVDVIAGSDKLLADPEAKPYIARATFQGAVARFESKQLPQAAEMLQKLTADPASPFIQQATFLLAECRREAGELDAAAALYASAAKKLEGPYAAESFYRLGFVRFVQGKFADAAQEFTAMAAKFPEAEATRRAKLYLGRSYLELKDYANAAATLQPLAAGDKASAEALLWLARTYSRQNQFAQVDQALANSSERFAKDPALADLFYEQANARMQQGKFADAAGLFEKSVAADPKRPTAPDAAWLRAYCLHREKQYAASLDLCNDFLKANPAHASAPDVHFLKAENLFLLQKLDEALTAYQAFLDTASKHPQAPAASLRIAQVRYQQKSWKEALAALEPLTKNPPKGEVFDQLWFVVGDCQYNLEKWDAAIAAFKTFTTDRTDQPNADAALLKLALAYQQKKLPDQAIATLTRLIASLPQSPNLNTATVELGRLYYESKQYAPARDTLARSLAIAPTPQALYYLGWVALAENKDDEAAEHFKQLAAKFPDHALTADATLQHAILRVRKNEFAEAAPSLAKLIETQPKHPKLDQALFYLGLCESRTRKFDAAIGHFKQVIENYSDSTLRDRALYEWAWAAKGAGKPDDAQKIYADLAAQFPKSPLIADVTFENAELDFQSKKYDAAIDRLTKLQSTLPADRKDLRQRIAYRLGWCHFAKGDMAPAAKSFDLLLADESADPAMAVTAAYQAGEARLKLKEFDAAFAHFARAAAAGEKSPVYEQSLFRLGETQSLTSRWPEAQQTYSNFLTKFPKSDMAPAAQMGLGWSLENQKQYDPALAAYRQVLALNKRDAVAARAQFQLGEVLYATGKPDDAVKELIKVEVAYGYPEWSSKALLEIGRVMESQNKPREAADRYKELIEKYADTDAAKVAKDLLTKLPAK
jgi:TolA-binding protein